MKQPKEVFTGKKGTSAEGWSFAPPKWAIVTAGGLVIVAGIVAMGGLPAIPALGLGGSAAPAVAVVGIAAVGAAGSAEAATVPPEPPPVTAPLPAAPTVPAAATLRPRPEGRGGPYFIYAVNTSGWSFFIGRASDVEGVPARDFADGGTGSQPVEFKKLVDAPFKSKDEAREYLKGRVTPGKQSVWTGTWLKFDGGEYRTVHVGL